MDYVQATERSGEGVTEENVRPNGSLRVSLRTADLDRQDKVNDRSRFHSH